MMRCEENGYMCFCDDAAFAAEVGERKFYKIDNVTFVPVNEARQNRDSLALIEDVRRVLNSKITSSSKKEGCISQQAVIQQCHCNNPS